MNKLDITNITVKAPVSKQLTACMLSDLHGEDFDYIMDEVKKRNPDLILIPGDITYKHAARTENSGDFLKACTSLAPTFMSLGNHENFSREYVENAAKEAGVTMLEEESVRFDGLNIGGLTSGFICAHPKKRQGHWKKTPAPNLEWLIKYSEEDGYKVLLSHHPEYYPRYERDLNIDLILSGHAHGGQWRFFGQPVFAPDQALFPRYAQGFHDGRLVVGRGLANNAPVPRLWNNREVIFIVFQPED